MGYNGVVNGKFKLDGRLDAYEVMKMEEELKKDVEKLLKGKDGKNVELDLTGVTYASSAFLRVLLWIRKRVAALGGGKVVLVGVGKELEKILDISGFKPYFELK